MILKSRSSPGIKKFLSIIPTTSSIRRKFLGLRHLFHETLAQIYLLSNFKEIIKVYRLVDKVWGRIKDKVLILKNTF